MRVRALGIALVLFGIAGVAASFGLWWMQYRYGESLGDAAGVKVECTQHCGGVDGPYLVAVVAGACLALIGLVMTVGARPIRSRDPQ